VRACARCVSAPPLSLACSLTRSLPRALSRSLALDTSPQFQTPYWDVKFACVCLHLWATRTGAGKTHCCFCVFSVESTEKHIFKFSVLKICFSVFSAGAVCRGCMHVCMIYTAPAAAYYCVSPKCCASSMCLSRCVHLQRHILLSLAVLPPSLPPSLLPSLPPSFPPSFSLPPLPPSRLLWVPDASATVNKLSLSLSLFQSSD